MAQPQHNVEKKTRPLDTEEQWVEVVNELNRTEADLAQVEAVSNSWLLVLLSYMGYGQDRQKLHVEKIFLTDRITYLSTRLDALNQERQLLSKQKQENTETLEQEFDRQESLRYSKEYELDPARFFARTMADIPKLNADEKVTEIQRESIYKNADMLTAASKIIASDASLADILSVWKVVAMARDLSLKQGRDYITQVENKEVERDEIKEQKLFNNNKKYYRNAQQMITNIAGANPYLQGLLFLYAFRDFDTVDNHLQEICSIKEDDSAALQKAIDKIVRSIDAISNAHAKTSLTRITGFNELPIEVQNELVAQQSSVVKLSFDLSFLKDKDDLSEDLVALRRETNNIENAVHAAIIDNKSLAECKENYRVIIQKIDSREQQIRKLWFKERLTHKPYITLGLGLGLAWTLGLGAPSAALLVGGIAVVKAHLETSPVRMRIPDIEESRNLAATILPFAFEDLQKFDALWGKGARISPEQVKVEIRSLHADVSDLLQSRQHRTTRDLVIPIVALYSMQLIAASLVFIAAGITLPIVWPIFAVIGTGVVAGITYVAGKRLMEDVNYPNSRIYKVASTVVQVMDRFIVQPVKYLFNKFKTWLFKPDETILKDNSLDTLSFDLLPEAVSALETMHPGLASQLSDHFKHRAQDLAIKILQTKKRHAMGENVDQNLRAMNDTYKYLHSDWHNIILVITDKDKFCRAIDKYLDRMYEVERKQFISVATTVSQELKTNPLLFDKTATIGSQDATKTYHAEQERVQQLCDLKRVVTIIKAKI